MKLAFSIALRFLSSNKGQTILIALGIAIGISVQVFIGSLIAGLQSSLVEKTIGSSSHVTVTAKGNRELISDYRRIIDKTKDSGEDITQITPATDASGFLRRGEETYPILVRGLDIDAADGIYKLRDALTDGQLPAGESIMIGKELSEEIELGTGDKAAILTPLGEEKEVLISGIYDLKVSSLNKSWAISEMKLVQETFNYEDKITSIEVQVGDVFNADIIAENLSSKLPESLEISNWKAQNESLLSGLNGQSISSIMIQVFVLISVVLAIASVLAISVLQKSKQLGILKAMGIKNNEASLIFLFQGLLLGILGAVAGVVLGLGLSAMFTKFAVNSDGTPVVALLIDPQFIFISGIIGVASATIASLIPAWRSLKLDPMEVIKNG